MYRYFIVSSSEVLSIFGLGILKENYEVLPLVCCCLGGSCTSELRNIMALKL